VIGDDTQVVATDKQNGLAQMGIGIFVTDTYNNPVPIGTQVHFYLAGANADTADVTAIGTTDEEGIAEAVITYAIDAATVTVDLVVTSGSVTETRTITLQAPPST